MRSIQINLINCEAAQDLLSQTIREKGIDVPIICVPYRNNGDGVWTKDSTGKAIWACGGQGIQEVMQRPKADFVRSKMGRIHIYSCYASSSETRAQYKESYTENHSG